MAYRVVNWSKNFENNRTKELKRLEWVPVPNDMSDLGYLELIDHPNGAAHLGAWLAILEIASKQTIRGEIPQAGAGTPQALARISRLPVEVFSEVIPRLVSMEWLEVVSNEQPAKIPQDGAEIPQAGAGKPALKGMEGNGIEGKHTAPKTSAVDDWFESQFWPSWVKAKNDSKGAALKSFRVKVKTEATLDAVLRGVENQKSVRMNQDAQYRAHAATWLNQQRWLDAQDPEIDHELLDYRNQPWRPEHDPV